MPIDPSSSSTPPLPSPAEIVQTLAPIRMPMEFAAFDWRDGLAAFSLGLLAAALLSLLLRPLFFRRVRDPVGPLLAPLRDNLADLANRPAQERLFGQAKLMALFEADPPLEPAYREALYRPMEGGGAFSMAAVDLDRLDGRILAAARQAPALRRAKKGEGQH